jgi:hypothetical protein
MVIFPVTKIIIDMVTTLVLELVRIVLVMIIWYVIDQLLEEDKKD